MNDDDKKNQIVTDTADTLEPEEVLVEENLGPVTSQDENLEAAGDVEDIGPQDAVTSEQTEADAQNIVETDSSVENNDIVRGDAEESSQESTAASETSEDAPEILEQQDPEPTDEVPTDDVPGARWYVVHTYSGHENRAAQNLKQRIESEHLENKILDVLVPTQDRIEIKGGKKETVKEKIFPGYILVKMVFDDSTWLAVRTTQGVTSFVGMSNKPTPIPASEVAVIVKYMKEGGAPTYKSTFAENDTVKIVDGPFAEFIGKVETVDKEKGKIRVLVSIFGRETPVELDFLQVNKL